MNTFNPILLTKDPSNTSLEPTLRPTKAIDELDYFRFDWVLSASNRYRLSTEIVS